MKNILTILILIASFLGAQTLKADNVRGATVTYVNGTNITIGTTNVISVIPSFDGRLTMYVTNAINVYLTTAGPNSLAYGSAASNTLYGVYVVSRYNFRLTNTIGLLSLQTNPTISSTITNAAGNVIYNAWRRVGTVRTYGDGTNIVFVPFVSYNNGGQGITKYDFHTNLSTISPNTGTNSTFTTMTMISNFIPVNATEVCIGYRLTADATNASALLYLRDSLATTIETPSWFSGKPANTFLAADINSFTGVWVPIRSHVLQYMVTSGETASIHVLGFKEDL